MGIALIVCGWFAQVRVAEHYTSQLSGHKQEVCGLKWSLDGQQLASGGNDNKLYVWSPREQTQAHLPSS